MSISSSDTPSTYFTILYFAAASDITKKRSETLTAPVHVSQLFTLLDKKYPGLKDKVLCSSAITVNLEYVDVDESMSDEEGLVIKAGDEVAIIPPVSSG
ncbi:hypothetical protein EJ05DRAFT_478363 [Pseudovirgaria hyperparasitica]|uniref:Molybdopterin synthase sulfur carrier subunit n=1 Tax=Pseudovirgaria hyperparasitica TaxID=470096 RepID=A0A6A6VYP5_9PEZI|nr:uncharacterized protein EJ05DRAFT_478363 [Pseudovirgaria hyperparasitica]KAF2755345.1 hypothetical protein EJ05DRAFT_478363 [Pseudovirgaria hyperparasitica]